LGREDIELFLVPLLLVPSSFLIRISCFLSFFPSDTFTWIFSRVLTSSSFLLSIDSFSSLTGSWSWGAAGTASTTGSEAAVIICFWIGSSRRTSPVVILVVASFLQFEKTSSLNEKIYHFDKINSIFLLI